MTTREAAATEVRWLLLFVVYGLVVAVVLIGAGVLAGGVVDDVFPGWGERVSRAVVIVGLVPCVWYGERVCMRIVAWGARWAGGRG